MASFLNRDFQRPGWTWPKPPPEAPATLWAYVSGQCDITKPKGRAQIKAAQERLRGLIGPALDAYVDGTGAEFERLVDEFAKLTGNPYRYERKVVQGKLTEEWERRPHVEVNSLDDHVIVLVATLFDADKLRLLGRCRHCGRFFTTSGRAKAASYAPGHRVAKSNEELRERGYFTGRYRKRVNKELATAKRYHARGARGQWLLDQLREDGLHLGKTLLRRHGLWDEPVDY